MKKVFIGVLIFGVLSFLITGALINISIHRNYNEFQEHESGDKTVVKEKTLDLNGRYDENDIEIKNVKTKYNGVSGEFDIPAISGLKDKAVEAKINHDIKSKIENKIDEILSSGDEEIFLDGENFYNIIDNSSSLANFSNVLSFRTHIIYKTDEDSYNYEYVYFNYELVNGERLRFTDLFTKDADLYTIIRKAFYRILAADDAYYNGGYYDEETGEWVDAPYTPVVTEENINKKINQFIANSYEPFYFNSQRIYFDDYSACVEFKDIADEVTIYDKYLTDESIYERNDIGLKNLWTCSISCSDQLYFREYGFLEDNLYYDIAINRGNYYNFDEGEYPYNDFLEELRDENINDVQKQVEKYRDTAKENPDKFYVVFASGQVYPIILDKYDYEARKWNYKQTKVIDSCVDMSLMVTSGENAKENTIKDLLEKYRYYNIAFYMGQVKYLYNFYNTDEFPEKESQITMYTARERKKINSISELFKEGINAEELLNLKLREELQNMDIVDSAEKLDQLVNEAEFYIASSAIYAKVPGCEYDIAVIWIDDEEIEGKLNIFD